MNDVLRIVGAWLLLGGAAVLLVLALVAIWRVAPLAVLPLAAMILGGFFLALTD